MWQSGLASEPRARYLPQTQPRHQAGYDCTEIGDAVFSMLGSCLEREEGSADLVVLFCVERG